MPCRTEALIDSFEAVSISCDGNAAIRHDYAFPIIPPATIATSMIRGNFLPHINVLLVCC